MLALRSQIPKQGGKRVRSLAESTRSIMNTPFAGFYQNYHLTDSAQSPDNIGNWGSRISPE